MEDRVLLAHLQALLGRTPDFHVYSETSTEHHTWLSQAHALIARWDRMEASSLRMASSFLGMEVTRARNVGQILGAIHRAIADLELKVPRDSASLFAPGDVYDVFRALKGIVSGAEHELLVIDPYLDASVVDSYLTSRSSSVHVRLLLHRYADDVRPAVDKYNAQHGSVVEARVSTEIHDRAVFVDKDVCWILGQSIKDAAKAKPTYLVALPPDVARAKLAMYEPIWRGAKGL